MKNYIQNELVCLRATEPIGSDRYEELSKAIQWLEENTINKPSETKKEAGHKYAHTTIRWKDNGKEQNVTFKLSPYNEFADKNIDEHIFFYCDNEEDYKSLMGYDNGQDFEIVGSTLYTEEL